MNTQEHSARTLFPKIGMRNVKTALAAALCALVYYFLDGEVDYLPEPAFLNVGTIEEAIEKGKKLLEQAKK